NSKSSIQVPSGTLDGQVQGSGGGGVASGLEGGGDDAPGQRGLGAEADGGAGRGRQGGDEGGGGGGLEDGGLGRGVCERSGAQLDGERVALGGVFEAEVGLIGLEGDGERLAGLIIGAQRELGEQRVVIGGAHAGRV